MHPAVFSPSSPYLLGFSSWSFLRRHQSFVPLLLPGQARGRVIGTLSTCLDILFCSPQTWPEHSLETDLPPFPSTPAAYTTGIILAAMTNNTETPRGRGRNAQETPGALLPQEQRTEVRNSYSEDGPGLQLAPALRPSPYPSPVHGVAGVNNTARGFHAPLSGHSALVEAAQTTEMAEAAEAARSLREMSGLRIPGPQAPRATGESPACTSLKRRARKIRERRARKVGGLNIISDDRAAMLLLRLSETGVNNDVPRPSLEMAHPEGSFGSVHTQSSRTTAGILWNWDYREVCPNPQSSGPMWSLPPSGNGEAGSDDDDRTISDPPSPDSDSDSDSENFDDE